MRTLATIEDEETLNSLDAKKQRTVAEPRWLLWKGNGTGKKSPFASHIQQAIKNLIQKDNGESQAVRENLPRARRARRNG
jgi:hypothetical protein